MGKISPVSAKYIIYAKIHIDGVVDKPDVIGAIFGQTEGLLGSDLELRELQRSGRIGRIDVNLTTVSGKTEGEIIIPSSLDKAETAIVGAALETIQKIGPCDSKIRIERIEDVRVAKRNYVIERAKELLKEFKEHILPDSHELTEKVAESVRMMDLVEYGKERLPAGPAIDDSEDIIVVEGRADVLNLLRHDIKNVIGLNGTGVPQTIVELSKKKTVTVFVDGDRGGDLIVKELASVADIDFVAKAPSGKEVEELSKKEIHKALRSRVALEQLQPELKIKQESKEIPETKTQERKETKKITKQIKPTRDYTAQNQRFKELLDDLLGSKGAYIVDKEFNVLGKVPIRELAKTLRNLEKNEAYAVVLDGIITKDIVNAAQRAGVKVLVGNRSNVQRARISIVTKAKLQKVFK